MWADVVASVAGLVDALGCGPSSLGVQISSPAPQKFKGIK